MLESHIFTGMQQDIAISKQEPQYLYEANNIRITAYGNDTALSIINEKGPKELAEYELEGVYLGHCVLNKYCTIFTHANHSQTSQQNPKDYIYRVNLSEDTEDKVVKLFEGNLGFDLEHPIECIGVYEASIVQKVYWIDGLNQPRLINIVGDYTEFNSNSFDFVQELRLQENVEVTRSVGGQGLFKAGTIQYAFTYYNLYGQESNIFHITPLHYTAFKDRGGSPTDYISNVFNITITNVEDQFDYLRIYSIFRDVKDATPIVKNIVDISLDEAVEIVDKRDYEEQADNPNATTIIQVAYLVQKATKEDPNVIPITIQWDCTKGSLYEGETLQCAFVYTKDGNENLSYFTINSSIGQKENAFTLLAEDLEYYGNKAEIYFYKDNQTTREITQGNRTFQLKFVSPNNLIDLPDEIKRKRRRIIDDNPIYVKKVSFTDTNTTGSIVDPQLLLYIGGEEIYAKTMEAKDGVLFLGNIGIKRPSLIDNNKTLLSTNFQNIESSSRSVNLKETEAQYGNTYDYYNSLRYNTAGFKRNETYRLGIQLQYKTGKWSEPIFLKDCEEITSPSYNEGVVTIPTFKVEATDLDLTSIYNAGYRKIRPIMVIAENKDRSIIAQGIANPTVYTEDKRDSNSLYAQSSWFFRPLLNTKPVSRATAIENFHNAYTYESPYDNNGETISMAFNGIDTCPYSYDDEVLPYNDDSLISKLTEIEGNFRDSSPEEDIKSTKFQIDWKFITLNSPEVELNDSLKTLDLTGVKVRLLGGVSIKHTYGDIDIITSSPTISDRGNGFTHYTCSTDNGCGITGGVFYDDFVVDDGKDDYFKAYSYEHFPVKYFVYPWQSNGSLNNDINRPANKGVRSSVIEQKIISNLRFADTFFLEPNNQKEFKPNEVRVFDEKEIQMLNLKGKFYLGNVDDLLTPDNYSSKYFSFNNRNIDTEDNPKTSIDMCAWWRTGYAVKEMDQGEEKLKHKLAVFIPDDQDKMYWHNTTGNIGDNTVELSLKKSAVRMRYKSAPHIVINCENEQNFTFFNNYNPWNKSKAHNGLVSEHNYVLPLIEVYREKVDNRYEGNTEEARRNNRWIPCGDTVNIQETSGDYIINFSYGDTWFQRYDCLKTYPYSEKDINQVVEICSFMVESHYNLDGRYDKNRGQLSNLKATPENYNKINEVYSQKDNILIYNIFPEDYYKMSDYPNQFTWGLKNNSGSAVDQWTQINLASVYDTYGKLGQITSINKWNDTLYCFQEHGISKINYNDRVQIPTSDGVPIEITNGNKVQGVTYLSENMGSINKYSISLSPSGIYFIDSISNQLIKYGDGIASISDNCNMSNYFNTLPKEQWKATADGYTVKTFYDSINKDLYIVSKDRTLLYSEKLGQFVSFLSYESIPAIFDVINKLYVLPRTEDQDDNFFNIWQMFEGNYNEIFDKYVNYDITFISNASQNQHIIYDKVFSNIDLRADKWETDIQDNPPIPFEIPFDYIQVTDEYQDTGVIPLNVRGKNTKNEESLNIPSNTKKKFRIWRIQIPRDGTRKRDRIRNTWCKIKLGSNINNTHAFQLHDLNVTYFI